MDLTVRFIKGLKKYDLSADEIVGWEYCGGFGGEEDSAHLKHFKLYMKQHPEFKIPEQKYSCICGHYIKENCYITKGGRVLVLGNCCVKRFTENGIHLNCAKCGIVLKRAVNDALCVDCKKMRICSKCGKTYKGTSMTCVECRRRKKCRKCGDLLKRNVDGELCVICRSIKVCKCGDTYGGGGDECRKCGKLNTCMRCRAKFDGFMYCSLCKNEFEVLREKKRQAAILDVKQNQEQRVHVKLMSELKAPMKLIYPFGKYKGRNLIDVHKGGVDKQYLQWVLKEPNFKSLYPEFINGVNLMLRFKKNYVPLYMETRDII